MIRQFPSMSTSFYEWEFHYSKASTQAFKSKLGFNGSNAHLHEFLQVQHQLEVSTLNLTQINGDLITLNLSQ